jgi:hypothetical protein
MKRLVIAAAMIGSAFIFTSCATNNVSDNASPQVSPYAPPDNEAVYDDTGFNDWPMTFSYPEDTGPDSHP